MLKEKVVVTGGAGFIGYYLSKRLKDEGFDVWVVDNLAGGKRENVSDGIHFEEADIRDLKKMREVIKGAKYVFHLAALPRVQFSIENPSETNDVNVLGTQNILIASAEAGVSKFIFSSSSSVYGDQDKMPLVETMEACPKSPYALHKYIAENQCKVWSEVYGLPTVSLRYFNVYGLGQDPNGPYALVIGKFAKLKKEGKKFTITGTGNQSRDSTHVNDVVEANILAAKNDKVGKGEVFNIGFGKDYSINELAKMMGGEIEYVEARLEPKKTLADNSKAKEVLGWQPKVSLEDGIKEILDNL